MVSEFPTIASQIEPNNFRGPLAAGAMQGALGMVSNPCGINAHDDDAEKEGIVGQHPLATQEWLASHILQKFGESGDVPALCDLSLINKNFLAASKSDPLWQKLLPPASHLNFLLIDQCDDVDLLQRYRNSPYQKALYQWLCQPISLAGGLQKFWLDRRTSRECYMISARALAITWGSSPEYWEWLSCHDAWFPEVAYLRSVCWFEIRGKFRQPLRPGSYTVSFRMQLHSASTWRWSPVKLSLQNVTHAHESIKSSTFFQGQFPSSGPVPLSLLQPPLEESGCDTYTWIECDVGEFTVEENEDSPVEVQFSMCEIEVLNWKTGFLLDGVFIRPSCVVKALERPTVSSGYDGANDNYDLIYDYGDEEESSASVHDVDDEFVDGVEDDAHKLSDDEEEATRNMQAFLSTDDGASVDEGDLISK